MATSVWYCVTCGYEVQGRGRRCHNCGEPLIESTLPELAKGEADDEVGYYLDGWEDPARGELISALIARGFRHRFEGDELVVAAEDEDEVDALIARLGTEGSDGDPEDPVPGEVLTRLSDAASRLQDDPTDMVADSDLAEAAAGLFAIDTVWGVNEETWAAIGRVTRRLLGALAADEALEDEIGQTATLLSRMLADLRGKVRGFTRPDAAPDGGDDGAAAVEAGGAGDGDEVAPGGNEVEEASGPGDEMVYELDDWRPEERAQIGLLLERDRIAYSWEGTDLVVAAIHDETVEGVLAEVTRAGDESPSEVDDETRYILLSDLFGAADRLAGDAENEQKQEGFVVLAKMIQGWSTPFAVSDDEWWKIRMKAAGVAESIDQGAGRATLEDGAGQLRDLLRQYV